MIVFDSTGYLFIGTGDGGGSGDGHGQSKDTLLGKLLRINVNGVVGSRQYTIPSGNPYVGKTGLDEIWSYGLRNPWRFSFDRTTGDLWIGDVGQRLYEEIDRSTVTGSNRGRGVNFGWDVMEGRHCYSPSTGCNTTGKALPGRRVHPRRGLFGDRWLRLSREGRAVARRPLRLRRLLLRDDLVGPQGRRVADDQGPRDGHRLFDQLVRRG